MLNGYFEVLRGIVEAADAKSENHSLKWKHLVVVGGVAVLLANSSHCITHPLTTKEAVTLARVETRHHSN